MWRGEPGHGEGGGEEESWSPGVPLRDPAGPSGRPVPTPPSAATSRGPRGTAECVRRAGGGRVAPSPGTGEFEQRGCLVPGPGPAGACRAALGEGRCGAVDETIRSGRECSVSRQDPQSGSRQHFTHETYVTPAVSPSLGPWPCLLPGRESSLPSWLGRSKHGLKFSNIPSVQAARDPDSFPCHPHPGSPAGPLAHPLARLACTLAFVRIAPCPSRICPHPGTLCFCPLCTLSLSPLQPSRWRARPSRRLTLPEAGPFLPIPGSPWLMFRLRHPLRGAGLISASPCCALRGDGRGLSCSVAQCLARSWRLLNSP